MAECLNYVGTPQCLPPRLPGTPKPPAPVGNRLVIQTGLAIKKVDNTMTASYNGTIDASMTTQYIADWNLQQVGRGRSHSRTLHSLDPVSAQRADCSIAFAYPLCDPQPWMSGTPNFPTFNHSGRDLLLAQRL